MQAQQSTCRHIRINFAQVAEVVSCFLLNILLNDCLEVFGDCLILLPKVREFIFGLPEVLLIMSPMTSPGLIHNDSIIIVRAGCPILSQYATVGIVKTFMEDNRTFRPSAATTTVLEIIIPDMSASKLSNSFSSSELGRINSYREQRMLIRPVSNHVEGEHLGISARNDLENIQQCLKNTILKRKESFNPSNDQQLGSDPFERVITQLDVETNHNGIQPNSHSPELQSPAETTRHKHFYKFTMLDSTLNIIEENPQPSVPIEVIEKTASGKQ
jgi:hypothetical protein